jgi:imidazolonepropionase-like amidohydrolase
MSMRLLSLLLVAATFPARAAQPSPPLLLEHANVVTMAEGAPSHPEMDDVSVLVENGRITAIGREIEAPPNAVRVPARGKFLLPGLTDMHAHFASEPGLSKQHIRDEQLLYIANGVTTVRNPSGSPEHLRIREQTASGEILGPRVFTSGPIIESRPSFPQLATTGRFHQLLSPEEAAQEVRRQKAAGYDFIKIYNQIDVPTYEAVMRAASEVDIPVFGHVPIGPGLEAAFRNHQASIEHLRGYDLELSSDPKSTNVEIRFGGWPKATDAQLDALVKRTVAAGAWNVPTLMVPTSVDLTPEVRAAGVDYRYVPSHLYARLSSSVLTSYYSAAVAQLVRDGLPAQCRLVRKLIEAGAPVMAGTDALVPGIAMHAEIRAIAACGVSNTEALRTATVLPGRWFEKYRPDAPRFGTVEVGKSADLVLYDANPIVDLTHLERIAGVVSKGQWLDRATLNKQLEALRERNAPELAKLRRR